MPREAFGDDFQFLPRSEILSFEEIFRLTRIFRGLGVEKIRLTGGEPLLRTDLAVLVGQLSAIPGIELVMTTNGSLLAAKAGELAAAGLSRVTVSLDSLDEDAFREMNDVDFSVATVLDGIGAAARAGLTPIKVNSVVKRGVNEHTVVDFARHFKGSGYGYIPRFIEYMDVGTTNGWRMDEVVTGAEIIEMIDAEMPLEPVESEYRGEVAKRWRYRDGGGEIGIITSVTRSFCGDCTRARLSADGRIYTCLFAVNGTDLRLPIREGATDKELEEIIRQVWSAREDRYSEIRSSETEGARRIEMSYIGG
jgi:cyclic pyranopterin phosphate synthase